MSNVPHLTFSTNSCEHLFRSSHLCTFHTCMQTFHLLFSITHFRCCRFHNEGLSTRCICFKKSISDACAPQQALNGSMSINLHLFLHVIYLYFKATTSEELRETVHYAEAWAELDSHLNGLSKYAFNPSSNSSWFPINLTQDNIDPDHPLLNW